MSADREGLLDVSDAFDSLIIIDRRVDMITPLLTQLTYEGLIDEVIHIKNCKCPTVLPQLKIEICHQPKLRSQHHSSTLLLSPTQLHRAQLRRLPSLLYLRKRNGNTPFLPQQTLFLRS